MPCLMLCAASATCVPGHAMVLPVATGPMWVYLTYLVSAHGWVACSSSTTHSGHSAAPCHPPCARVTVLSSVWSVWPGQVLVWCEQGQLSAVCETKTKR